MNEYSLWVRWKAIHQTANPLPGAPLDTVSKWMLITRSYVFEMNIYAGIVGRGRKQNNKIKLGICGEHGGDPKSINFCSKAGLDYVSCSPFRVPVARLAAAQAQLKK